MTLRDKAFWWDSFDNCDNVDKNVLWADVQREFIAAYAPRFTARTICTTVQDLVQRQGQNIHVHFLRVTELFRWMNDAKSKRVEATLKSITNL